MGAAATVSPMVLFKNKSIALPAGKFSPLLLAAPYLGKPTQSSITVNIIAGEKDIGCYVKFRKYSDSIDESWQQTKKFSIDAFTPADIVLEPLRPGTLYQYQVYASLKTSVDIQLVAENIFRTQRVDSSPFSFALISDSHITPFNEDRLEILSEISSSILAGKPDFLMMLGDNIQTFTSHGGPITEKRFGPIL